MQNSTAPGGLPTLTRRLWPREARRQVSALAHHYAGLIGFMTGGPGYSDMLETAQIVALPPAPVGLNALEHLRMREKTAAGPNSPALADELLRLSRWEDKLPTIRGEGDVLEFGEEYRHALHRLYDFAEMLLNVAQEQKTAPEHRVPKSIRYRGKAMRVSESDRRHYDHLLKKLHLARQSLAVCILLAAAAQGIRDHQDQNAIMLDVIEQHLEAALYQHRMAEISGKKFNRVPASAAARQEHFPAPPMPSGHSLKERS